MSEPLTWHDLDQIADFTAGQLTGPDSDRVARLIATDPRWAVAHRALNQAEPAVRAALARAAALPVEPMPVPSRRLTRTIHWPSPARRRPVLAGLAVILVFAGVGAAALIRSLAMPMYESSTSAGDAYSDASQPPRQPGIVPGDASQLPTPGPALGETDGSGYPGGQPPVFRSERDYQHDDLAGLYLAWPAQRAVLGEPAITAAGAPALATAEGFAACVGAVASAHSAQVTRALFAHYQGSPALFLALRGEEVGMVVVVGPECGRLGTDEVDFIEVS